MRYFFILFVIVLFSAGCETTLRLYRHDNPDKDYHGVIEEKSFILLKDYLLNATKRKVRDTIIIKYEYNYETCWDVLDRKEDKYIMGFVVGYNERVKKIWSTRLGVSAFNFREPGRRLNKIKKYNDSIIIDSSRLLFKSFFRERCVCGSSIMILPDRRFIYIRSDSHSNILDMTGAEIEKILNMKQKRQLTKHWRK